ncbi:hypothetical protein EFA46_011965 (plasmid) [Halarchaeum sp. CBA1220]|uniref:DUF7510 family protein n=1 Tax=Halarchaeum sp. CBA1220 TaxID=1853682 RepID=UPI000F3A9C99|nr:hypothetical protein [Halarchaeum sp. CBA1220]QLC34967.1 hypothetical protein EFA46_011965 [Halarchaeum sp. CBA1220]
MSDSDAPRVSVDATVDADGTVITIAGTRDAAVVVYSASGEEIYLPPEDFEDPIENLRSPIDSPYESTLPDSPYDPVDEDDETPYDPAEGDPGPYDRADDEADPYAAMGGRNTGHGPGERVVGVESTPSGFRIVHPEPAHDVRVVGEPRE